MRRRRKHANEVEIVESGTTEVLTAVDRFWGQHQVRAEPFTSPEESSAYLDWRVSVYPHLIELMELDAAHDGDVVLEYGCGPGHDVMWFLLRSRAARVIAVDASPMALQLTRDRVALHSIPRERIELVRFTDAESQMAVDGGSVDYIHSLGVVHHVSSPHIVLREFARVLKPGGRACIMVYSPLSVFFHLYIPYQRQILDGDFPGLSTEEAFARSTDGEDCPIVRLHPPEQFLEMGRRAGFEVEFRGGFLAQMEIDLLKELGETAIADGRLADEHRAFLRALTLDDAGYPRYDGRVAGHGGVYMFTKPG
jgi:ubiquinone/menaquinone biosynthesis C-methylase UbiE